MNPLYSDCAPSCFVDVSREAIRVWVSGEWANERDPLFPSIPEDWQQVYGYLQKQLEPRNVPTGLPVDIEEVKSFLSDPSVRTLWAERVKPMKPKYNPDPRKESTWRRSAGYRAVVYTLFVLYRNIYQL